jgi:hypothetical protein
VPVRPPDENEVAALAASYGMKRSPEEVTAYTPIVAAFLSSYDAVEELHAGIAPQAPSGLSASSGRVLGRAPVPTTPTTRSVPGT